MNLNMMNLLVGKMFAEREGLPESRSFQLGLIAGMMPSMQGVMMAALIARRERPEPPASDTTNGRPTVTAAGPQPATAAHADTRK